MNITIFGVFLCIFLSIYIIKNFKNPKLSNHLFFYSVVALLILDIGYFVKVKTFTVEYNYIFSVINLIFSSVSLFNARHKHKKNNVVPLIIFVIFLLISMLLPLVFNMKFHSVAFNDSWDIYFGNNIIMQDVGFSTHSFGMFIRCIIFVLSFYSFSINLTKEDLINYIKKIFNISYFVIGVVVIEFIMTNFIDVPLFRNMCFKIFGFSDSTYFLPKITEGGLYLPMGFMREPSSFARSVFIMCVNNIALAVIQKEMSKKIFTNIIILMVLLLLSKSLSGYIFLGAIIMIFFYCIKNKKVKRLIWILIPIIVIILFCVMGDRIIKIFESFNYFDKNPNELTQSSEVIRLYSIVNNLKYFLKNLFIGCGFGTIYCYSAIVTMLSNIGIVGVSIYIYIIYKINSIAVDNEKFSWFTLIIIFVTHILIGHMSYLIYLETIGYLLIILKAMDSSTKRGEKK